MILKENSTDIITASNVTRNLRSSPTAQRRATKAAIRASDAATLVEKIPSAPSVVDVAALDKKLEEILTTPEKV